MSIYETSVRKPITTALIYVAIAILGLFSLSKLAVELMPKTDTTNVMVLTSYPGASAEDIETNVTKLLENNLNGINNLKHISSNSRENASIITLEFKAGTPIAEATNDIRDKLDATTENMPAGAKKPVIFKFDNSSIPVAILSVQAKESAAGLDKILELPTDYSVSMVSAPSMPLGLPSVSYRSTVTRRSSRPTGSLSDKSLSSSVQRMRISLQGRST